MGHWGISPPSPRQLRVQWQTKASENPAARQVEDEDSSVDSDE